MQPFNYNGSQPIYCFLSNGTLALGSCSSHGEGLDHDQETSLLTKRARLLDGTTFGQGVTLVVVHGEDYWAPNHGEPPLEPDSEVTALARNLRELYDDQATRDNNKWRAV